MEPTRRIMRILEPNGYKGELSARGHPFWIGTENVFLVNGEIFKADGDFIEGSDEMKKEFDKLLKKKILLNLSP